MYGPRVAAQFFNSHIGSESLLHFLDGDDIIAPNSNWDNGSTSVETYLGSLADAVEVLTSATFVSIMLWSCLAENTCFELFFLSPSNALTLFHILLGLPATEPISDIQYVADLDLESRLLHCKASFPCSTWFRFLVTLKFDNIELFVGAEKDNCLVNKMFSV